MVDIDIHNNPTHFMCFLKVNLIERQSKWLKLLNDERYVESLKIYDCLIEAVTWNLDSLYVNRWSVLYEMGNNVWAIESFKKALLINVENKLALEGLLMVLSS